MIKQPVGNTSTPVAIGASQTSHWQSLAAVKCKLGYRPTPAIGTCLIEPQQKPMLHRSCGYSVINCMMHLQLIGFCDINGMKIQKKSKYISSKYTRVKRGKAWL